MLCVVTIAWDIATQSIFIMDQLEICREAIPIHNINHSVLTKVIEWCEHHKNDLTPADAKMDYEDREIAEWDKTFIQVDQELLIEIILAANYLDIQPLLGLGCRTLFQTLKGKSGSR
ncbi:hypothetical protein L211DRAFT_781311 [Terfezia boudieri ATCC MYA-4762]|uniref:SKP1 component POZ domain-containing protein n=1 Tax=Terfezia boudieri ATCC MYA-4762 TaxID=1051890 RepID=A0A3N4LXW7_9PEZI|nr:hypothetical protein L211DRAFT_781311 [Terfezia boudieri ATCC MYA-4762]